MISRKRVVMAGHLQHRAIGRRRREIEQRARRPVREPDLPGRTHDDDPFHHAVEERRRAFRLRPQLGFPLHPLFGQLPGLARHGCPPPDPQPPRGGHGSDQKEREEDFECGH